MPILGILASSYLATPAGSFESISTYTLPSNQTSVTFSSIPSTYLYLELRYFFRTTSGENLGVQFNSDSTSSYTGHRSMSLVGYQTGWGDNYYTPAQTFMYCGGMDPTGTVSQQGSGQVMTIFDYTNTSKYKSFSTNITFNVNGSSTGAGFISGVWKNTSAINSIRIFCTGAQSMVTNSTFSLYGMKAS